MNTAFTEDALAEYIAWQTEDEKTLRRINELIKSIKRDGFLEGMSKPEALKGQKAYSRRIDDGNRLVYIGDENKNLLILSCKGHYKN